MTSKINLLISLLTISLVSFSQQKKIATQPKIDSSKLKIELDKVLAKYGLKSKGFTINVTSTNQKGGQTAYSITNNFLGESIYIPDSLNFSIKLLSLESEGNNILIISPKSGVWHQPFVLFDTAHIYTYLNGGMINLYSGFSMVFKGVQYQLSGVTFSFPCSINDPIRIALGKEIYVTLVFGDASDAHKTYVLHNNSVTRMTMESTLLK